MGLFSAFKRKKPKREKASEAEKALFAQSQEQLGIAQGLRSEFMGDHIASASRTHQGRRGASASAKAARAASSLVGNSTPTAITGAAINAATGRELSQRPGVQGVANGLAATPNLTGRSNASAGITASIDTENALNRIDTRSKQDLAALDAWGAVAGGLAGGLSHQYQEAGGFDLTKKLVGKGVQAVKDWRIPGNMSGLYYGNGGDGSGGIYS